jgi:hypothetical protein
MKKWQVLKTWRNTEVGQGGNLWRAFAPSGACGPSGSCVCKSWETWYQAMQYATIMAARRP